jgi:hypothetical protein
MLTVTMPPVRAETAVAKLDTAAGACAAFVAGLLAVMFGVAAGTSVLTTAGPGSEDAEGTTEGAAARMPAIGVAAKGGGLGPLLDG